jgi:hypothetical protein
MEVIKMPGGDGTGPMGRGPMTGRAAGLCAGYPALGYTTPGYGQGYGRGLGRGVGRGFWGRGRRFWYRDYHDIPFNQPSKEEEKDYLKNLVKNLEDELKAVKDRLQDLTKEKKD